jgi:hypothetical protein
VTHCFKHTAYLAVTALRDGHSVPAIGSFTAAVFNGAELRNTIVKLHAVQQLVLFFTAQATEHPDGVLAL